MARIALSALQQRDKLSGTGRYIAELFADLPGAAPEDDLLLYCKADQAHNFAEKGPRAKVVVLRECPSEPVKRVLWEYRNFTKRLQADGVDLYHGPANFLPGKKVCPYVLTLHDMVYFHNPKRTTWLRAKYWQYSLRKTVPLADCIITVSEFSKREILKYLRLDEKQIRVVLNGVSERFFIDATAEEKQSIRTEYGLQQRFILFLGRLDADKNPLGLIEAYHELLQRGVTDYDLAFSGNKDYRSEELWTRTEALGISERVKFLGFVPDDKMIPLLQSAAAFCYPSFNEGFGLPVLEAMAAGVPVVTSNISSLPEVVGDAGIQVDPFSAKAIADGLAAALRPERGRELAEAGRARARTMSWRHAAEQTAAVYHEVLRKGALATGHR